MYTKKDIKEQLAFLGVPSDRPVLVHSSLRAVGEVEGRADGLIDALREHICARGGLLCIPTHTWANLGKEGVITLDFAEGATCIGTLPNVAARRADAIRSLHPTHSMAVFGEQAAEFVLGEGEYGTPADPKGCYGRICERGGYILLVGVGHNRNTYLHCVEEMLGVPNRLAPEESRASIRLPDGRMIERMTRGHFAEGIEDVSAQFPNYENAFRYHGAIRDGRIGNAASQLCDARIMRDVMALIYERSGGEELLERRKNIPEEYYEVTK